MNFKNVRLKNMYLILYYFIYRVIIDFIYIKWVSPTFNYMELFTDIVSMKVVASYILMFFISLIIPKGNKKVSQIILQLHYIIMIIPLLSIYAMANLSTSFTLMVVACFSIQIILVKIMPQFRLKKIKNGKLILYIILGLMTGMTYIYLLNTQPINLEALNFTNIYDIRAEQYIPHLIMKYLIVWQYRIINPTILVFFYIRKNYKGLILIISLQVLLYLMYPHKEVILAIGLLLLSLFITEKKYTFDKCYVFLFSLLSIISTYLYAIFDYLIFFAIFPVRMLNIPAKIKFEHFNFFSTNDKLHYSEGMIGKILGLNYPYSVSSGVLINPRGGNSNTGYIAYAYDNLGFTGMIIMSLIFVFILKLIDSLAVKENKGVIFTLFIYSIVILNDGDLLTMLLTGGLWLQILILFLYKNIDTCKGEL